MSGSFGLMFTDAKNTSELLGKSSTIGASGGYLGHATVDVVSFEEMENMSGDMDGFQIGLGGGAGVDIHMMESNTKEICSYNIFQAIGDVLEIFSGKSGLECEN